jgi:hypothetical protein
MKNNIYLLSGIILVFAVISSCKKEYSCENCIVQNKVPLAFAGKDTTISLPKESLLLDGSLSTDPDGSITAWNWRIISGSSNAVIRNPRAAQTIAAGLVQGIYFFELKVTDNDGAVDTDTVKVNVSNATPVNQPPVADAGVDQVIVLPVNTTILNGAISYDPDNNITGFAWSKISGPSTYSLVNPDQAVTSLINLVAGTYQFKVKVTDAGGLFDEDTVVIKVVPPEGSGNVYFFFRDTTGSLDAAGISVVESFEPVTILAKVTIAGYPDAPIEGFWSLNRSPVCPIISSYVDSTAYGSFIGLPAGTYSWTAESVTTNLVNYPLPAGFIAYWNIYRKSSGSVTVQPNNDCILVEIIF